MRSTSVRARAAAVSVAMTVAVLAVVAVGCEGGSRADAARDLLAAIRRSHAATYTAEGTFERTPSSGSPITDEVVVVQDPPQRMALGYGSWDGVVDGRGVHCIRDGRDGAWLDCEASLAPSGRPAPTSLEDLQAEQTDEVEDLIGGDDPLYGVERDGDGCFVMTLQGPSRFPPPYGQRTRWCFDATSGATSLRRIEHADATDVTRYDRIRAGVALSDFPPKSSIRDAEVPMGNP